MQKFNIYKILFNKKAEEKITNKTDTKIYFNIQSIVINKVFVSFVD